MTAFHNQRMVTVLRNPEQAPLAVEARMILPDVVDFLCQCGITIEFDPSTQRVIGWVRVSSPCDCSDIVEMTRELGASFSKDDWKQFKTKPPLFDALSTLTSAEDDWELSRLNDAAMALSSLVYENSEGSNELLESVVSDDQANLITTILSELLDREDSRMVLVCDASLEKDTYSTAAVSMLWTELHIDVPEVTPVPQEELDEMDREELEDHEDELLIVEVQQKIRLEFARLLEDSSHD